MTPIVSLTLDDLCDALDDMKLVAFVDITPFSKSFNEFV